MILIGGVIILLYGFYKHKKHIIYKRCILSFVCSILFYFFNMSAGVYFANKLLKYI